MACLVGVAASAGAQESFAGKTIKLVVAYSPGGSFDLYTRLIARHIGKHLPGKPSTIVQNMTGAAGMIAANYVYNTAKPDGLTIGAFAGPLVLQHVMGNKAAKFDGRKFGWLGVPAPNHSVCSFNQKSGVKSMDDWFGAKREIFISAIGPGTSTSDIPKLMKAALGLPTKVIDGYRGGARARVAVEAGEADGYCGSLHTVKALWREPFETGEINLVVQKHAQRASRHQADPAGHRLREDPGGAQAAGGRRLRPPRPVPLFPRRQTCRKHVSS